MIVLNLLPYRVRLGQARIATDGLQLLQLLWQLLERYLKRN